MASLIAEAAGRPVRHVRVPIEEVRKFSGDYAAMLEWFEAVGYDVDINGNAARPGIAPARFRDWVTTVRWT